MGRQCNTSDRTIEALAQSKYRTLTEAARALGVTTRCLKYRLANGWPIERVFALARNDRTFDWLEEFTGFSPKWAKKILARAGLSWRWASEQEIRAAIVAHENNKRAANDNASRKAAA